MSRLTDLQRSDVAADVHPIWDEVAGTRGSVRGPFQVLIRVPELCDKIAAVGKYLRWGGLLDDADRELAIIATGRECGVDYEYAMHEPIARKVGVRPEAIEVVDRLQSVDSLQPREQLLIEVARTLATDHRLTDELYARALKEFGEQSLVELVGLVGFYCLQAVVLGAFDVEAPAPSSS
jgi:4-carboxymuconolactone decarboxylase